MYADAVSAIPQRALGPAYVTLIFLALGIAILLRHLSGPGDNREPDFAQTAFLLGGQTRTINAATAALRRAGAVDAVAHFDFVAVGRCPPDASPLLAAVYGTATQRIKLDQVGAEPAVRAAVDQVAAGVRAAGWAWNDGDRARTRVGMWIMLGVAAIGAVDSVAIKAGPGGPIDFLVGAAIFAGLAAFSVRQPIALTGAAKRVTAAQRRRYSYLNPAQNPSWTTYGPDGVAMAVALYGAAAIRSADPGLAERAGLSRPRLAALSNPVLASTRTRTTPAGSCGD